MLMTAVITPIGVMTWPETVLILMFVSVGLRDIDEAVFLDIVLVSEPLSNKAISVRPLILEQHAVIHQQVEVCAAVEAVCVPCHRIASSPTAVLVFFIVTWW